MGDAIDEAINRKSIEDVYNTSRPRPCRVLLGYTVRHVQKVDAEWQRLLRRQEEVHQNELLLANCMRPGHDDVRHTFVLSLCSCIHVGWRG